MHTWMRGANYPVQKQKSCWHRLNVNLFYFDFTELFQSNSLYIKEGHSRGRHQLDWSVFWRLVLSGFVFVIVAIWHHTEQAQVGSNGRTLTFYQLVTFKVSLPTPCIITLLNTNGDYNLKKRTSRSIKGDLKLVIATVRHKLISKVFTDITQQGRQRPFCTRRNCPLQATWKIYMVLYSNSEARAIFYIHSLSWQNQCAIR